MNYKNVHLNIVIVLTILWLLLSGHFIPLLLGIGLFSVIFTLLIVVRMGIVDQEGTPTHMRFFLTIAYWLWLFKEIVKSSISVCRLILARDMPIQPVVVVLKGTQKTDLSRVILANSITLTPGTVCIDVDDNSTQVHVLAKEYATALTDNKMDKKIAQLEET